jgi:hypothetical protein
MSTASTSCIFESDLSRQNIIFLPRHPFEGLGLFQGITYAVKRLGVYLGKRRDFSLDLFRITVFCPARSEGISVVHAG